MSLARRAELIEHFNLNLPTVSPEYNSFGIPFLNQNHNCCKQAIALRMPHRRGCLTVATSSDSMAMQGQVLAITNESCFYRDKQGIKGLAAPFSCTPNPRRSSSASLWETFVPSDGR
jgi:hypothetical protein